MRSLLLRWRVGQHANGIVRVVACSLLLCALFAAYTLPRKSTRDVDNLQPPQPYQYESTMAWVRRTNLTHALRGGEGLKDQRQTWVPTADDFDYDAALHSKFGPWLTDDEDADAALAAAKAVNRWRFTEAAVRRGEPTITATPGMHLYILRSLRPVATAGDGRRTKTFVDAGCGTGLLLEAWTQLAGSNARAVGLELDATTFVEAQRNLAGIGMLSQGTTRPEGARISVHLADALAPDVGALDLREGEVDAINVGVAVDDLKELEPLGRLLRPGGLMAAPLCKPRQPASIPPSNQCAARIHIMRKGGDGSLSPLPSDPGIEVRFIRADRSTKHESRSHTASA